MANAQPRYAHSRRRVRMTRRANLSRCRLASSIRLQVSAGPVRSAGKAACREQSYEQQLGRARAMVQEDPERVASVLKDWVAADA